MASIGEVSECSILIQESVIRSHHVFKEVWAHDLAKFFWLTKKPETLNLIDRRAVALIKVDRTVVGHAPREFARVFWHFLACA